jgi:hypothetical protein
MPPVSEYHRASSNWSWSKSKGWYERLADRQSTTGGTGGTTVREATKGQVLAVAPAFASILAVLTAGATAVWLTDEVRVFGLVALPTAIVASLLVVYVDWREKHLRRKLAEPKGFRKAA